MKIFVAGHNGLVGSAIVRRLTKSRPTPPVLITRTRAQLDLTDQKAVAEFFTGERPDVVILAAAKVGGILANNTYPAEFIYENLMIECNIIHQAFVSGVKRLLFFGSSCIYPKNPTLPIVESALLTGKLEQTNEPYALAKIAGLKLCDSYSRQYGVDYRAVMPTNIYGPQDNFHPQNAHVIPALIGRLHTAASENQKEVTIWGTGEPKREFLHVDDLAAAAMFLLDVPLADFRGNGDSEASHINVGIGLDIKISHLARLIADVVDFRGELTFDQTKPDGTMCKRLDVSRLLKLGWTPEIGLRDGLTRTYHWYRQNLEQIRT